jgi:hypothetical protein
MTAIVRAAVDNARWCDAVARAHGIATEFRDDAWTAATRTPPFFPDAVTLRPDAAATELLGRIDASAGCSIKDSFASLDLEGYGFRVLFEARWIVRQGGSPPSPDDGGAAWMRVREAAELAAWESAWSGGSGTRAIFRAELLAQGSIDVLAAHESGRIVAGAVLTRSDDVIGVSNVFSLRGRRHAWTGCLAQAALLHPGAPLVGYESGDDLEAALEHGFEATGPLRVWIRD